MHMRSREGSVEFLYEDGIPIPDPNEAWIRRASVIMPMQIGVLFMIVWEPHIQPFVGETITYVDDAGKPFKTEAAAKSYERERLIRDYFVQAPKPARSGPGN